MKTFSKVLMAVFVVLGFAGTTIAATAPTLGAIAPYAVYSDAGVTNFGGMTTTHIWGNVGHNGLGVTNLLVDPGQQVAGTIDVGAGVAAAMGTAYGQMIAAAGGVPFDLAGTNTIGPGVYDVAATTLNGTLTLSGAGVYIFRGSSVPVSATANMVLTNGADACNVFRALTTRMHVVGGAHVIGTIITDAGGADITLGDGASLQGRALAHTAITLRNNAITEPTCTVVVPTGGSVRIPRLIPLINILKVPTPLVLVGSGSVTYNYTVQNIGPNLALRNVTVNDDKCGPVTLISGDVNNDGRLELTEKWYYRCTTMLSSTATNTVTVYGESDDSYRDVATDTATAIVVVGTGTPIVTGLLTPPLINIVKIPSRLTPFLVGGGDVTYTYTVTNPGVVAMHDVIVTDDKCSLINLVSGDANHDHMLDVNETWTYTCESHITASTKNTATAKGEANGFTVYDYAFANVYVTPGLPKTGLTGIASGNLAILGGIFLIFSISFVVALRKRDS